MKYIIYFDSPDDNTALEKEIDFPLQVGDVICFNLNNDDYEGIIEDKYIDLTRMVTAYTLIVGKYEL